jgi:WS/DGAT/MGAT family acyltransferase
MSYSHYERLSALDDSFLELEDANTHMHIGAVGIFDAGPVTRADGGVDIDRIRDLMEANIHRVARYRQRLAFTPISNHPVWIDDARFNLTYHVRHTHLPKPGDERQLKRLAGRLMSQQLDRGKPLWEMWVVEGLEGDRFAVITKIHHCMIDGVGSAELMGTVMRAVAEDGPDRPPPRWIPRPAPSPREMVAGELRRRLREPFAVLAALGRTVAHPLAAAESAYETLEGLREALSAGLRPASPTPLNVDIGPHRRFDWIETDLAAVRAIKGRLGGTVNDVVLAVLSGALGHFFHQRGLDVSGLDVRAMLPVNVRDATDRSMGNRVASIVARLPLEERDPRRRLERVTATTRVAKLSRQAAGMRTIEEIGDRTFTSLFVQFARLAALSRPFNLIVTNVPGPSFPVYVLGAPMQACYPLVPLFRNQALGIALFSYAGKLCWGFNADWDAIPDLHDLVEAVGREFERLSQAAGTGDEGRTLAEAVTG